MKNTIKSLQLGALALVSLPTFAFANLGDPHERSNARYGKTYRNDGFTGITVYAPTGRGWIIYEWFNENGIVEAIEYYQANGKYINQQQGNQLTAINGLHVKHWDKTNEEASGSVWMSDDKNWRLETSWDGTMGAKPLHRMVISTPHGCIGMQAALGVDINEQQQVVNTALPVSL
jgi:hypothetical protein